MVSMKINKLNRKQIMKNYHKVIEFVIKDSKKYERPNSKTHMPSARAKLITTILLATLVISLPIQMAHSEPDVYFAATYEMSYSKYDSSTDREVWVSIHKSDGTVTHHQITNTPRHDFEPSIAIAPNGNIIVAWWGYIYPLGYAVLDSLGRSIKSPTQLSSSTKDYIPCVAVTPNSVVFVVYEDYEPAPDQVAYVTMDDDGENVSSEKYIQGIEGEADYPTIAASIHNPDDNRVIIAWVEYDTSTATSQIFFTILDSTGGTLVPRTKITDTSLRTWDPNAAILPDGKAVIVWEHAPQTGLPRTIQYAIIDESGLTFESGEISYNNDLRQAAVAATPQGNIVIVWRDNGIMYMLLDSEGNMIKAPASLSDPYRGLQADIAVNTLGIGVGIWESRLPEAPRSQIMYAFLDSSGNKLNGPRMLTDGTYSVALNGWDGTRQIAVRPAHITTPVGGLVTPTNKLAVLSPYLALAGLIVAISTVYVVKRRKD